MGKSKASDTFQAKNEMLLSKIFFWMAEGHSKGEIKKLIKSYLPALSERNITNILDKAILKIEELSKQDIPVIVSLHLANYERIYEYFKSINHAQGMNKALRAKEKLLGLLKEKKLVINQNKTTIIEKTVEYDVSKLSPEKQKRLEYLLNKAKA